MFFSKIFACQKAVSLEVWEPDFGAVAQLEERLHGMQEVVGSIPIGSTSLRQDFDSNATSQPLFSTI